MDAFTRVSKLILIFSPVIVWSLLIWYIGKWDKKYRSQKMERIDQITYVKKKRLMNFLLWVTGVIATVVLLILWAKIGLQEIK